MDPPWSSGVRSEFNRTQDQQTARVVQVEAENALLRAQLEAFHNAAGGGVSLHPTEPKQNGRDELQSHLHSLQHQNTSAQMHSVLVAKYNELHKRYRDLENQHRRCQPRIEAAVRKYREAKAKVKEWQDYISRKQLQREKSLISPHDLDVLVDDGRNGTAIEQKHGIDGDTIPQQLKLSDIEQQLPSVLTAAALSNGIIVSDARVEEESESPDIRKNSRILCTTSSQTTDVGYGASNPGLSPSEERQLSDNEPVVVSSKSLRRKGKASSGAMPPPARIKQESNSFEEPIEIKSDHFSSPIASQGPLIRAESSDLDFVAETMDTPRKRRQLLDTCERTMSVETMFPGFVARPSSPSHSELPGPQKAHYPWKEFAPSMERLKPFVGFDAPVATHSSQTHKALQPVSANVLSKRGTKAPCSMLKRRRCDDDATSKVAILSEDGEAGVSPTKLPRNNGTNTLENDPSHRLDALLHKPSPELRLLARTHVPLVVSELRKSLIPAKNETHKITANGNVSLEEQHVDTTIKPESEDSSHKRRAPQVQRKAKRLKNVQNSALPLQPENEPLRLRPLASLRLEDFKINPKYAGAEFAFRDSLRSKEQQRCLPGCTKTECCGAFIKAVEMGARPTNKSDAEVLESFLGECWEQIMGAYPRDKRDNILKQARATALAKEHGKHRQAFERRSTPPGYWRTDMPTTQEAADDRAKAQEMVRQKVEERWREAMRGNERWLFRDE